MVIRRELKNLLLIGACLILFAFFSSSFFSCGRSSSLSELKIGALLSLTGQWSSLGKTSKAAMEIAVNELNAYLFDIKSNLRVSLVVKDTKLDPNIALQEIKNLAGEGIRIVIGPQSSSEVAKIKNYANNNGILVVSQGSTAESLAVTDDNIFRFCPDDTQEAKAMTALMWEGNIRAIVPVWRDDADNKGLHDAVVSAFTTRGGAVYTDPNLMYSAGETDFADEVANIHTQVAEAINDHGAGAVGIYLAAFDEVVNLFNDANQDALLHTVFWYGSDGVVQSDALVNDPVAARFAVSTGYPNPILGDPNMDDPNKDIRGFLKELIKLDTGLTPNAFAFAAYDALYVALYAYQELGLDPDIVILPDIDTMKAKFVEVAAEYKGATGFTKLNNSGDRLSGNFDFWAICGASPPYQWERVGKYQAQTGTILYQGCTP